MVTACPTLQHYHAAVTQCVTKAMPLWTVSNHKVCCDFDHTGKKLETQASRRVICCVMQLACCISTQLQPRLSLEPKYRQQARQIWSRHKQGSSKHKTALHEQPNSMQLLCVLLHAGKLLADSVHNRPKALLDRCGWVGIVT